MKRTERSRILIVEDEALVSLFLEDALQEMGFVIAAVATGADEAAAIIESSELDAAILDVNLGGETSLNLAHMLRQRNVPFIFATGYGSAGVPKEFAAVPVLTKPFTEKELKRVLGRVFEPLERDAGSDQA